MIAPASRQEMKPLIRGGWEDAQQAQSPINLVVDGQMWFVLRSTVVSLCYPLAVSDKRSREVKMVRKSPATQEK